MGVYSNTRPQTAADAQATADVLKENAAIAANAKGQATANANAKPAKKGANARADAQAVATEAKRNAADQLVATPGANDRANNGAKGNEVCLPINLCGS